MTRNREIATAISQGCLLSEVLHMSAKRPSYAARVIADELEALDMAQSEDCQPWTTAYKAEVIAIIQRGMR